MAPHGNPAVPEVPAPRRELDVAMSDGAVIRLREYGPERGPMLLLSHGNGFAIDGYYPFWGELAARFRTVVLDMRNHGRNQLHDAEAHNWLRFTEDMRELSLAIRDRLRPAATVGVFHSLSAIANVHAAARFGRLWDALVLFEPPLNPPPPSKLHEAMHTHAQRMAAWAAQRPDRFDDPEELARQFRQARSLGRLVPGTHSLMARAILSPAPAGGWTLTCPRERESVIYRTIPDAAWDALATLPQPALLVGSDVTAGPANPPALLAPEIAEQFRIPYAGVRAAGHLMQVEQPEACRRIVMAFMAEHLPQG